MSRRHRSKADYEVGYGKPPIGARFRKGQSGNKAGRPKARRHEIPIEEQLIKAINQRVIVTENGEKQRITKLEAALKQLANKAAMGDTRALKLLVGLVDQFSDINIVRPFHIVFEAGDEEL